jgi:hypothetical protein
MGFFVHMKIDLDNVEIDLNCPKCGFANKATLQDVRVQATIICRGCKVDIKLVDKNASLVTAQKSIDEGINDLSKAFKKIGKIK